MPIFRNLIAPLSGMALLLAAAPVPAAYSSGNELLEFCRGTGEGEPGHNVSASNACVGYLAGIADAHETWVHWGAKTPDFCVPDRISTEQLRHVFLRRMDQVPEDWHLAAASLVINAFIKAWPCPD